MGSVSTKPLTIIVMPVHDEQLIWCENCNGRHWIETCGHPESRSGFGGACCGACEAVECSSCSDGSGPFPYGVAPVQWDEDTVFDWLVTDRDVADDDYPWSYFIAAEPASWEIPF